MKKKHTPGAGTGRGHPFEPTADQRVQVRLLVGLGLTHREVASVIINPETDGGISVNTLEKYFSTELSDGAAIVKAKVTTSLFRKAISDVHPSAAACAMFIMKCRFGWRQEDRAELPAGMAGVLLVPAGEKPDQWIARNRLQIENGSNSDKNGKKPNGKGRGNGSRSDTKR